MFTQVRNIEGDVMQLKKMIEDICRAPARVRVGVVEVQGSHQWKIAEWLIRMGF